MKIFCVFLLVFICGCGLKNVDVFSSEEVKREYISDEINFAFYDTKGFPFKMRLIKKMDSKKEKNIYYISLSLQSDKKYLSKENGLKITLEDGYAIDLMPKDNGRITAYNIDPYYVIDEIAYEVPHEVLLTISKSKTCNFYIKINDKPILAFLNKLNIHRVSNFLKFSI